MNLSYLLGFPLAPLAELVLLLVGDLPRHLLANLLGNLLTLLPLRILFAWVRIVKFSGNPI